MTRTLKGIAVGAALVSLYACSMFDTDISNPNAIEESALGDPASAPTQANGLNSAVTRMITSVYGPYSVASDELTWVGSREYWGKLDAGDVADPRNEYADAAYSMAGEARWLSDYTVARLEGFDATNSLASRLDLARTYVSAAVTYITIGDNFDDFVFGSDRTNPTAPVGEANMATASYDKAIALLDLALPIATTPTANTALLQQIYGLRARAKFSRAVWVKLHNATRTTPASPLVNDVGASADATLALSVMTANYRYRVLATSANTGTNNIGSEMNSRQEVRAGNDYINPTANNLQPLAGTAGIKLNDPITGTYDVVMNTTINECCRAAALTLIPFTLTSEKEMQLILAEAALATGNNAEVQTRINNVRARDALPAWNGTSPTGLAMLQHERRVNLFMQSRRLHDMYRFGQKDTKWLTTSTAYNKSCFLTITAIERQANLLAPQPVDARPSYCP